MDHLGAGVGLLVIVGHRDRVELAHAVFAVEHAAWIFPRHRAAGFDLRPADLAPRALAQAPLGDEIVDSALAFGIAGVPVLHRRILDLGIFERDQFDHCGVELVLVAHRRGAAFEIADVAAFLGNDQRAFELARVLRIDAEIGRQLHRAAHAFGDVNEGAVRKDRAVQRCEEVVMLRHHLAEPLLHQLGIFLHRLADREEDHARFLEFFAESGGHADAVEHRIDRDLAGSLDPGEHFLFRHGNAELVVHRLDLGIELVERFELLLLLRRRVIIGVLVIDRRIAELGPVGLFHFLPQAEGLQPPVEHPLGLALLCADEANRVFSQPLLGEFGLDIRRPAVLVLGRLFGCLARFAILDVDVFAHAISLSRASWVSGIAASAPRNASLTTGQCGLT